MTIFFGGGGGGGVNHPFNPFTSKSIIQGPLTLQLLCHNYVTILYIVKSFKSF